MDVFGIHGMSGIIGTLAVGIFATPMINSAIKGGLIAGNPAQIGIQALAIIVIGVYSFVITFVLAKIIEKTMGLRVKENEEVQGLDINLHEESGYRLS
jgi:Amt family ammonium transporter